jgi:hypothetical protein
MAMKRSVTVTAAVAMMLVAGFVQAEQILVAAEFERENVIVESGAMSGAGGSTFDNPNWVEVYPFPAHFGPVD